MAKEDQLPENEQSRMLYLIGGADSMSEADQEELLGLLVQATSRLTKHGVRCEPQLILSGGTDSGVAGVAAKYGRRIGAPVHGWLPHNQEPAKKVIPHHHDPKEEFTIEQPLAMWEELAKRKAIQPNSLAVVATSGTEISNAELAVAAASDVPIALLPFGDPEQTEAALRLFKPDKRQILLPADPMALRVFLLRSWGLLDLPPEPESDALDSSLKEAAVKVHKDYRAKQSARREDPEPAEVTWRKLKRDLKKSNLDQAAAHIHYVREAGVAVSGTQIDRRAAKSMKRVLDGDSGLAKKLAELEHGRWTVERFEMGIRRGPRPYRGDPPDHSTLGTRIKAFFTYLGNNVFRGGKGNEESSGDSITDPTHSDVVAWVDLPAEVRDQDLDAIKGIPGIYDESLR